jgi:Tfp pilus assembly protein PilF
MKNAITILGVITLLTGFAPDIYAQPTQPSLDLDKAYDLFRQGEAKLQSGDYREAIEDYNQVLKLDVANTDAYVSRGVARFGLGDKQGAIDDFTKALQLDANNADVYRKRGGVYMTVGNKRAAREDFQQATKLSSSQRNGTNAQPQQSPGLQQ